MYLKIKIGKINFTRNLHKDKYIYERNEKKLKTSLNLHIDLTLLSMSHKYYLHNICFREQLVSFDNYNQKIIPVTLNSLNVVLVRPLKEAINMPTHMGAKVVCQAFSHRFVRLLFATQTVENKTLHGLSLAMLTVLRIAEDLLGIFETIFILLVLVAS